MRLSRRAAAGLLGGAAAIPLVVTGTFGQQLATLRLASPADDNTSAALYAIQAGVFAKYGLDVSIQRMNNGAATAAAVVGGAIDLAKTSLIALFQAHERGIPFVMVAGGGLFEVDKPTAGFIVAVDSPIVTIPDLNGRTISTPSLGDIDQISMTTWIDRDGGDASTVHFIELPLTAALPAIETGRIAGSNVQNPAFAEAQLSHKFRVLGIPFSVIANRFLLSSWFGTTEFVAKNAATVRQFVSALREAVAYATAHPEATAPLLSAYSGIPASTIDAMQRQPMTAALDPRDVQPVLDIAVKGGLVKKSFPVAELFAPPL